MDLDHEFFYRNAEGKVVMKEKYHLKRGYCCGTGCYHCPFEYVNVLDEELRTHLIRLQKQRI